MWVNSQVSANEGAITSAKTLKSCLFVGGSGNYYGCMEQFTRNRGAPIPTAVLSFAEAVFSWFLSVPSNDFFCKTRPQGAVADFYVQNTPWSAANALISFANVLHVLVQILTSTCVVSGKRVGFEELVKSCFCGVIMNWSFKWARDIQHLAPRKLPVDWEFAVDLQWKIHQKSSRKKGHGNSRP